MKKWAYLFLFFLLTLFPQPIMADQSMCVNDRVIDPLQQLAPSIVREWTDISKEMDRYGFKVYLYVVPVSEIEQMQFVGDLSQRLLDQGNCGLDKHSVVLGITPNIPQVSWYRYEEYGASRISYASVRLRGYMMSLHLPNHHNDIMYEFRQAVETLMLNETWYTGLIPVFRTFSQMVAQVATPQDVQRAQAIRWFLLAACSFIFLLFRVRRPIFLHFFK